MAARASFSHGTLDSKVRLGARCLALSLGARVNAAGAAGWHDLVHCPARLGGHERHGPGGACGVMAKPLRTCRQRAAAERTVSLLCRRGPEARQRVECLDCGRVRQSGSQGLVLCCASSKNWSKRGRLEGWKHMVSQRLISRQCRFLGHSVGSRHSVVSTPASSAPLL